MRRNSILTALAFIIMLGMVFMGVPEVRAEYMSTLDTNITIDTQDARQVHL